MNVGVGLYVHIPFCKSKCHYCDFNSYEGKEHLFGRYQEALKQEMFLYRDYVQVVNTIYFGGGTPSILPSDQIMNLLDAIRKNFYVHNTVEITIEVNPGTVSRPLFSLLRAAGVSRLSMGLQSFHDENLKNLGRIHTVNEFLLAYKQARDTGFDNINIDLIFGLPWQTFASWQDELSRIVELAPEHVSLYDLTVEPQTRLGEDLRTGRIQPLSQEIDAKMYEEAIGSLKAAGYEHYEISNFAKPGKRCRHNQIYWRNEEYLGIGAGATSYLGRTRYTNVKTVEEYIEKIMKRNIFAVGEQDALPAQKLIGETIMLQLRLLEGFDKNELQKRFKTNIDKHFGATISVLTREGLVRERGGKVCLTEQGLMVANQVFSRFV